MLVLHLFVNNSLFAEVKPEKYMPYPIIFVSGIGTKSSAKADQEGSPSHDWPNSLIYKELEKYFIYNPTDPNSSIPKYEYQETKTNRLLLNEKPHLEFLFYNAKEVTVDINAEILQNEIEKILSNDGGYYDTNNFTYTEPCSTPKVIIVAHSYGGVIARYMLVHNFNSIDNKVAAVFFLGTPQLGSPLSVIGYFIPKEIPYLAADIKKVDDTLRTEDFTDRYWDKRTLELLRDDERKKLVGDFKFIRWAETDYDKGLNTSVRNSSDDKQILIAIAGDAELISLYSQIPRVSQKGAVLATLMPDSQANTYRGVFCESNPNDINNPLIRCVFPDGELHYDISGEAVLSNLGTNVGVNKAYAIIGTDGFLTKSGLNNIASGYMSGQFSANDYDFEKNHLWENGDGVMSIDSQNLIGTRVAIPAAHTTRRWYLNIPLVIGEPDYPGNILLGIPSTPNIILKDIDDVPVIESVRLVKVFSNTYPYFYGPIYYLVIKAKDYLLADIKIDEMTVGGVSIKPEDYYDSTHPSEGYKPYFKLGKDFLKERDFTVTAPDIIVQSPTTGQLNPLVVPFHLFPGEFVVRADQIVKGNFYLKIENPAGKVASCALYYPNQIIGYKKHGDATGVYPANPEFPVPATYADTLNLAYRNFINSSSIEYDPMAPFGLLDKLGGSIYSLVSDYHEDGYETWEVNMDMNYRSFVNFSLNVGEKTIKEIKLIGNLNNSTSPPALDFNILIYSGNQTGENNLLFTINTASIGSGALVQIPVNLENVNGNGDNGFVFKPDFNENNCFDGSNAPKPTSPGSYIRDAGFHFPPELFVTFEENNP